MEGNDDNIIHLLSCFEKLFLTTYNRPFAFSCFLLPRILVELTNVKRDFFFFLSAVDFYLRVKKNGPSKKNLLGVPEFTF